MELAEAVLETTSQLFLVLNRELVIVRANSAFLALFKVSQQDTEARSLRSLGNGQWNVAELLSLLDVVLERGELIKSYRIEHTFEQIGRRVMLLNATPLFCDGQADRVLLAINDITDQVKAQHQLTAQLEFGEKVFDAAREALLVLDFNLHVRKANETFYKLFRLVPCDVEGHLVFDLGNGRWDDSRLRELLEQILPNSRSFDDFQVEHDFPGVGHRILFLNARRIDHLQFILLAIEDVTERRRAEEQRELLARELSHRVKNTLAVVQSFVAQTVASATTVNGYRDALLGRLNALARAHTLLIDGREENADLFQLVEEALAPFRRDTLENIGVEGARAVVSGRKSLGLMLILHELATNAAKYGSLSCVEGRIDVSWRILFDDGRRHLVLSWRESNGPTVEPAQVQGFGSRLIRLVCKSELSGMVDLTYAPDGLVCTLDFPF